MTEALLMLAEVFQFHPETAKRFIRWVQDSLELRERGEGCRHPASP